ncbi:MAG: anthranilate synthase component I [Pseudomonadota bacterium]
MTASDTLASSDETPGKEFRDAYERGVTQLLSTKLVSDLDTPVSAYLKLVEDRSYSFLLESVEGGDQLGRYSIIGLSPDAIWRCDGGKAYRNDQFAEEPSAFTEQTDPPLESLKKFIDQSQAVPAPNAAPPPPMASGVFGYLGYALARDVERLPPPPPAYTDTPDAVMMRPTLIAVFDNVAQEIILVTAVRPKDDVSAEQAFDAANKRLASAEARLCSDIPHKDREIRPIRRQGSGRVSSATPLTNNTITSSLTPAAYKAAVNAAKEHIFAGDIFQAVLSQRFETDFTAEPFSLYRALRRSNPSPFLFYLDFDGFQLVGSSPEILVRVRDSEVTIRPIAGTRPRGATAEEDQALEQDLLSDEKERAEHLMLLDLGRNDVGRSSEIGSVKVTSSFTVERYSHVMHIVSNVVGKLKKSLHPVDAVMGGFPAGTVTGAPKIRAMEIINDLETSARGPYAGTIGYFSGDGTVDTCITLRTGMVKDGKLYVQAGAGVVADSDPDLEQAECENKAKALFRAAELAEAMEG